ncbi:MAG: O-antigen ligase family protein [Clostridia bacterium]|nr:O-antigen ligase family protein [Clostridia bacterium]
MDAAQAPAKKGKISIECILAGIYFFCLPFTVVETPFGSLLKLVSIPIIAILVVRLLMGKSEVSLNSVHLFYALYILYSFACLLNLFTPEAFTTVKDMLLGFATIMLISMRVYTVEERDFLEWVWLFVGVVCILIVVFSREVVQDRAVIRVLGFVEDQNQFCAYFIMASLLCIKRLLERKSLFFVYLVILVLCFYAILKTGSRGGLLGILAGISAYLVAGIQSRKARIAIIAAGLVIILLVVFVLFPMLPESIQERYTFDDVVQTGGSGRVQIWRGLIKYTVAKPERIIWGSGVLSSYDILQNDPEIQRGSVAHNSFIQIFSDQGLIGLLLFLFVMAACIIKPWMTERVYACAFISLIAFSMSLTFYTFKPYINIMMMCAMGFEDSLLTKSKEREKKEL